MRSEVAEKLRDEDRKRMLAMSPSQRVELALRLGDEAVASYAATHGVTRAVARRTLRDNAEKLRPRPFPAPR